MMRVVRFAVFLWISLGTLLMFFTSAMALSDPKLHFGFGIVRLMGARALIAALPLALCGLAGLVLSFRHRRAGAYLLAAFSFAWAICLGSDMVKNFDPVIAVMATLYLLSAIWSLRMAQRWNRARNDRATLAAGSGSIR